MKEYVFGNLMDWGSVLEKLDELNRSGELDNHQDELIRLIRFDGNWRLREAAVEAMAGLGNPEIDTAKQLLVLIRRDDLYFNIRVMATQSLSTLLPVMMEKDGIDDEHFKAFMNDVNHEVTHLLSSPLPPIFHDALDMMLTQVQKASAAA